MVFEALDCDQRVQLPCAISIHQNPLSDFNADEGRRVLLAVQCVPVPTELLHNALQHISLLLLQHPPVTNLILHQEPALKSMTAVSLLVKPTLKICQDSLPAEMHLAHQDPPLIRLHSRHLPPLVVLLLLPLLERCYEPVVLPTLQLLDLPNLLTLIQLCAKQVGPGFFFLYSASGSVILLLLQALPNRIMPLLQLKLLSHRILPLTGCPILPLQV
mmetsp:Transcript_135328/g.234646  ORF Transcript_135328/g.234646 Transcript_135328/m.234646 type:complete len:216 (-) Transcript_135328:4148-4795(-)